MQLQGIARFFQEYEIINKIKSSGVIQTHGIISHSDYLVLIAYDKPLVKILDFGISNIFSKGFDYSLGFVENALKYSSPEQTGRMNRLTDYRSDYYSLGITFYEMLTGHVPFNYTDSMELVHAHIARTPVAPNDLKNDIPAVISDIVMKLMAKTCEERYQSAYSIANDLRKCRDRRLKTGIIENFQIAQNDIPHVYIPPQIIAGRDNEIAKLKKSFENACNGKCEFVLVEGEAGIGKSSLIKELVKPIIETRGYFISGKYSPDRKNVPYSAFIQAFKDLVDQILSENPEVQNDWKNKLIKAVGQNGQVLKRAIEKGSRKIFQDQWKTQPISLRLAIWLCYVLVRLLIGMAGYAREKWSG